MLTDLREWERAGRPVDHLVRLEVEDFLFREAELVDDRRYNEWLDLFDDDLEYRAPARVWRSDPDRQIDLVACIWNDTKPTLAARVQRLGTDVAWTEVPPSVLRHFVTNVRVHHGREGSELVARCNLLVTRNRGPAQPQDVLPVDRYDVLRRVEGSFRISRRTMIIDSTNPNMQNLAIFL